jgi:hypothetical protein
MIQYDAPEVCKITLNTKRSLEGLGVVDDEHIDWNSGKPLQTRTARFTSLRAFPDA